MLEARALTKFFGRHRALDGLSLRVENAERLVILGPSGAGKTTLLRLLAGLEAPNAGAIELDGRDVTTVAAERRRVGLVFQQGAIFAHVSVFENLAFPLRVRGLREAALRKRVDDAAALFAVEHLVSRPASGLSAGERQRVAIARALLADPGALLLDEPLAHLDPTARGPVRDALLRVALASDLGVVLVTHDHEEALAMADRLAIVMGGKIVQCEKPARVYDRPASTAVASFLGPMPMNLFADTRRQFGEANVTLGIRPQHIRLNNGATDIEGVISSCEFAGTTWVACVQTALGTFRVADPAAKPSPGERVRLAFAREEMRRFSSDSGEAIA